MTGLERIGWAVLGMARYLKCPVDEFFDKINC